MGRSKIPAGDAIGINLRFACRLTVKQLFGATVAGSAFQATQRIESALQIFLETDMRFLAVSISNTLTFTKSPTETTSLGSDTN